MQGFLPIADRPIADLGTSASTNVTLTLATALGSGVVGTVSVRVDGALTLATARADGWAGALTPQLAPQFTSALGHGVVGLLGADYLASVSGTGLVAAFASAVAAVLGAGTATGRVGSFGLGIDTTLTLGSAVGVGRVGVLQLRYILQVSGAGVAGNFSRVISSTLTLGAVTGHGTLGGFTIRQPRIQNRAHPAAIEYLPSNDTEHRAQIARTANLAVAGNLNVLYPNFTLTHGATTTTIIDDRIGPTSILHFMPTSAAAATAHATVYVSNVITGQATVHHASNAALDQTFTVSIISG